MNDEEKIFHVVGDIEDAGARYEILALRKDNPDFNPGIDDRCIAHLKIMKGDRVVAYMKGKLNSMTRQDKPCAFTIRVPTAKGLMKTDIMIFYGMKQPAIRGFLYPLNLSLMLSDAIYQGKSKRTQTRIKEIRANRGLRISGKNVGGLVLKVPNLNGAIDLREMLESAKKIRA